MKYFKYYLASSSVFSSALFSHIIQVRTCFIYFVQVLTYHASRGLSLAQMAFRV